MKRVDAPHQIDLFGDRPEAAATSTNLPTVVTCGFGGKADAAAEVLGEVGEGRYGLIEGTQRIVWLDGEGRCRHALNDVAEIVESLLAQRYAKLTYVETMRHGAIAKPVCLIALTPGGGGLHRRWSALHGRRSR
ncbi:hypothetical protein SAMN04488564_118153 [Lentzea waywayandensis]|uniref:Uncharacterized protein n=1 Tax=Lentzea waywayandensis TaxID=84724 RepID=A0A1I6FHF5_9PSEU|nr:hypothetical protein [Lentzea waywayandensis]SFR29352.1 hypothetical protein SAMN04488564_118153 [Lentzea waywayandensis]